MDALFSLDPFLLDEETLNKVLIVCPTSDDEKILKENVAKINELTTYEQYIYAIMKVPRLR